MFDVSILIRLFCFPINNTLNEQILYVRLAAEINYEIFEVVEKRTKSQFVSNARRYNLLFDSPRR